MSFALLFFIYLHRIGLLAEWLGAGLQNRLLRFESGRDLKVIPFLKYRFSAYKKAEKLIFIQYFPPFFIDETTLKQVFYYIHTENGKIKTGVHPP